MGEHKPAISVIIPFHNASYYLERCLSSVRSSRHTAYELLLVDDGSTDSSADLASLYADRVISLACRRGPAFARNRGCEQASGDILFFVDADVLCSADTLDRVEKSFAGDPGLAAVIGSYDDEPPERNLLSRYKNLTHHFVHQMSSSEASTFWTGCGAIRRDVFVRMQGFDESFRKPSIEDIELGYRLRVSGERIKLCKDLTVKHAKRWNLMSLLKSDILDRAIPWTILQLSHGKILNDLNLSLTQRLSAVLVWIAALGATLGAWRPELFWLTGACMVPVLYWNRKLYGFYWLKGGLLFSVGSVLMHWLYYLYSVVAFAWAYLKFRITGRGTTSRPLQTVLDPAVRITQRSRSGRFAQPPSRLSR